MFVSVNHLFNTLRPRQGGRHFADDIFMCNFFNENCCILIKFSLKYVRKGPIDNNPALVQIMTWRRSGDTPLSEPMMISLPTHICVTRPQWVKAKLLHETIQTSYQLDPQEEILMTFRSTCNESSASRIIEITISLTLFRPRWVILSAWRGVVYALSCPCTGSNPMPFKLKLLGQVCFMAWSAHILGSHQ